MRAFFAWCWSTFSAGLNGNSGVLDSTALTFALRSNGYTPGTVHGGDPSLPAWARPNARKGKRWMNSRRVAK